MHFTPAMILHRLLATLVLAGLVYYLGWVLGWREIELRIAELDWRSGRGRYRTSPYEVYFLTLFGWAMVVCSQVFGGWLANPDNYREWPWAVGGWLCMLAPSVAMYCAPYTA